MIELTMNDIVRVYSMASSMGVNEVNGELDLEVGPRHNRHKVCVSRNGLQIDPENVLPPLPDEVPDEPE